MSSFRAASTMSALSKATSEFLNKGQNNILEQIYAKLERLDESD